MSLLFEKLFKWGEKAEYSNLGSTVYKLRRRASGGLSSLTKNERVRYANAIEKGVKARQRAALLAAPAAIRRARTDDEWAEMYEEAMKEKRRKNK